VVVLGDSAVGKTAIIHQLTTMEYRENSRATIGCEFSTYRLEVGSRDILLQIWDTAGEERFTRVGATLYRGLEACVLVFDLTNLASLQRIGAWKQNAIENGPISDPDQFPFVIFGNKSDQIDVPGRISPDEIQRIIGGSNVPYFEVSAKTGDGIAQGFQRLGELFVDWNQAHVAQVPLGLQIGVVPTESGCCH
jgi:Ras-related protein Rab-7A